MGKIIQAILGGNILQSEDRKSCSARMGRCHRPLSVAPLWRRSFALKAKTESSDLAR